MLTVCAEHVGASTIQSLVLDKEGNRSSHLKGKDIKDISKIDSKKILQRQNPCTTCRMAKASASTGDDNSGVLSCWKTSCDMLKDVGTCNVLQLRGGWTTESEAKLVLE